MNTCGALECVVTRSRRRPWVSSHGLNVGSRRAHARGEGLSKISSKYHSWKPQNGGMRRQPKRRGLARRRPHTFLSRSPTASTMPRASSTKKTQYSKRLKAACCAGVASRMPLLPTSCRNGHPGSFLRDGVAYKFGQAGKVFVVVSGIEAFNGHH